MKKNKVKIDVSKGRESLESQIDFSTLKCEPLFIPWIETMLNSVYNLLDSNVIDHVRANKYMLDIAGDRLRTHLAVWNPELKIKISYK